MNPVSQFDKKEALLVIVDVQDALMKQMDQEVGEKSHPKYSNPSRFRKGNGHPHSHYGTISKGIGEDGSRNQGGTGGNRSH